MLKGEQHSRLARGLMQVAGALKHAVTGHLLMEDTQRQAATLLSRWVHMSAHMRQTR